VIRALIIIDSINLLEAVELLQLPQFSYSKEQAEQIFVPAGSPNGEKPATKHWLSGELTQEHWQTCQQLCQLFSWANVYSYNLEEDPLFPYKKLQELGIQPIKFEFNLSP
jgi:hypothetical protein